MTIKNAKKKVIKVIVTLTIMMLATIGGTSKVSAAVYSGFNFEEGDIVVTSSTSSAGLTGHAGIVLPGGNSVAHIAGPGKYSTSISISQWLNDYPKTKIVRCNNSITATGASYFARNYFINGSGRTIGYSITPGVYSRNKMYCSKLVWQCYEGAGLEFKEMVTNVAGDRISYKIPSIIHPYEFINPYSMKYNGFYIAKSFNW